MIKFQIEWTFTSLFASVGVRDEGVSERKWEIERER